MAKIGTGSFEIQPRDIEILRGLFESRLMTATHVAALHFDGRAEATKKRLYKLNSAGLIIGRRSHAFEPAILFLTRQGLAVLRDRGILREYPAFDTASLGKRMQVGAQTIRHELEVMDVKSAFHTQLRKLKQFRLAEFTTWPALHQFEARRSGYDGASVLVKPDGFIRIHERESDDSISEHTFFLELDRSTETLDTLVARAGSYLDYYKSGGFAVKNGASSSEFQKFPFRVLIVCKTAERRNNVAERLLAHHPPILTQVCLTTYAEAVSDPLGKVWFSPRDYREAVQGTPFQTSGKTRHWGYQRDTTREIMVEQRVVKRLIFE